MIMYDAYCFDLYGTLADIRTDERDPKLWQRMARWYAAHGADLQPDAMRLAFFEAIKQAAACSAFAVPEPDIGSAFSLLFSAGGVRAGDALIEETAWLFRRASTRHLRLYAGAKELLAALRKNGRVLLLSNAQRLFTMPEIRLLGLLDCFDAIYLSSELGCQKQDPSFFARVIAEQGLVPSRCIMIGNDPFADAQSARLAGMDAYCIRSAISPENTAPALYDRNRMNLRAAYRDLCKREPERECPGRSR